MAKIMPIKEMIRVIELVGHGDDWEKQLIYDLHQYRSIMEDAFEIVSDQGQSVIDFMEEHNLQDSEEDTLTQTEQQAWIGLCEILGYDYPIPDWYKEMWIDT